MFHQILDNENVSNSLKCAPSNICHNCKNCLLFRAKINPYFLIGKIFGIYFNILLFAFYTVLTRLICLPHNNNKTDFLKERKGKEEMASLFSWLQSVCIYYLWMTRKILHKIACWNLERNTEKRNAKNRAIRMQRMWQINIIDEKQM